MKIRIQAARFTKWVAGFFLAAAVTAQAGTVYWDADGTATGNSSLTGAGLGGAGNWNTSDSKWWNGSSDSAWVNGSDTALFWGTAGTVTNTAVITVGGLTFNTTGYILDASANGLTFGAADNAITLNNIAAAMITGTVTEASAGKNVRLTGGKYGGATAGTLTLNGTSAGGWSGTTTIGNGMTMSLSGLNQGLKDTSGVMLNGGAITLTYADTAAERTLNRVNDFATITANGGTITYTTTTPASINTFAETLGVVNLLSGQLAIVESLTKTAIGQTLTLGGLSQSGSSAVLFSSGINRSTTPRNVIIVSGAPATAANKIIGPWATYGTTAIAQSDYAIYLGGGTGELRNASATTGDSTWSTTWADTNNYNFANTTLGTTLTATRNLNTIRHSGSAESLDLGGYNLGTYGILNGVASLLTITNSTGWGVVTLPTTTASNLYVTTGSGAMTIAAPITDNTGALTLVKSGTGGALTLSGNNTFSGGLVINAGHVQYYSGSNLGPGGIIINGNAQLGSAVASGSSDSSDLTYDGPVSINNGANLYLAVVTGKKAGNYTFNGPVTGTGGLQLNFGSSTRTFTFASRSNSFEGPLVLGNVGSVYAVAEVNSLADSITANGVIRFPSYNSGQAEGFRWGTGATNALVLNNRQFDIGGTVAGVATAPLFIENANTTPANTLTINTDLLVSSTLVGTQYLGLRGGNTGRNTFAGRIADGAVTAIGVSKLDAGTWVLSGSNTYSGATAIDGGILCFANTSARPSGSTVTVAAAGSTGLGVGGAGYYGSTDLDALYANTLSGFSMNASSGVGIDTTAGDFIYASNVTAARPLTKLGANTLTLTGANTHAKPTTVLAGTLLVNGTHSGALAYTIGADGALGGTGTITMAANNSVTNNGTLAPGGAAVGTLSIAASGTGKVVLGEGAKLNVQVGDKLAVTGELVLPAVATVTVSGSGSPAVILSATTLTGDVTGWTVLTKGYKVNKVGNTVVLTSSSSGTLMLVR